MENLIQFKYLIDISKFLKMPIVHRILEAMRAEWWHSTPRFASLPDREDENRNV